MLSVLICTLCGFTGFYLLMATVPEYAAESSGNKATAGVVTGVLMAATVAVQPAMPRILSRIGYRLALVIAMFLLGLPVVLFAFFANFNLIVLCSALRGLGFGVFVVASSAAVADLAPAERRGQATGWYGVATGLGGAAGTPFGVLLAHQFGYLPLFVAGFVMPMLGLIAALGITAPRPTPSSRPRVLTGLRRPALLYPFVLLSAGTMASGAIVTFLPIAAPRDPVWVAPIALLLFQLALAGSRWLAGRIGDRFGNQLLLLPATLLTAVGILGGTVAEHVPALLLLMLVLGTGAGALQNATLVLMLQRSGPSGGSVASAQWNLAFDAGLGIGGFCVGVIAQNTSYPVGFVAVAVVLLATTFVALADAKSNRENRDDD
ncbi:MFS transporter [Saccharopolyspora pogona]|uniref:MFS transporter n=1 Tax=Saccharopolyspora pogona TaxID=333966 RepID=UPI00168231A2|nr:MFS transporter [Saccharopolyspora pogona]